MAVHQVLDEGHFIEQTPLGAAMRYLVPVDQEHLYPAARSGRTAGQQRLRPNPQEIPMASLNDLAAKIKTAIAESKWNDGVAPIVSEGSNYRIKLSIHGHRIVPLTINPHTGTFEVEGLGSWPNPARLASYLENCGLTKDEATETRMAIVRAFKAAEEEYGRDIPYGHQATEVMR